MPIKIIPAQGVQGVQGVQGIQGVQGVQGLQSKKPKVPAVIKTSKKILTEQNGPQGLKDSNSIQ